MIDGKNSFPLKLNRKDIAEIVDQSKQLRIQDQEFIRTAPYDDVHAVYTILSLVEFMKNRRVDPGFEVVLSE